MGIQIPFLKHSWWSSYVDATWSFLFFYFFKFKNYFKKFKKLIFLVCWCGLLWVSLFIFDMRGKV